MPLLGLRHTAVLTMIAALLPAVLAGGCAGLPNSRDVVGERVEIRMLTYDDLDEYHEPLPRLGSDDFLRAFGDGGPARFQEQWLAIRNSDWILGEGRSPVAAALLPALAVPVINLLIDTAVAELDAQAKSYEAQYRATRAFDGFWLSAKGEQWVPAYVGFEIIRYSERFPAETAQDAENRGGASRMIVLFARSQSDPRLFLLHPFFYANRSAKAKVDRDGASIAVTADVTIDAVWIARGQALHEAQVAAATFRFGGYPMTVGADGLRLQTDPATQAAGWFGGVPVSTDGQGEPTGKGVFRITAQVTERDESKARERIERVSEFVSSRRDQIVEQINEAIPES